MFSAFRPRLSLDGIGERLHYWFLALVGSLLAFALLLYGVCARVDRNASFPFATRTTRSSNRPRSALLTGRACGRLTAAARDRSLLVTDNTIDDAATRVAALHVDRPGADALAVQNSPTTTGVRHILSRLVTIAARAPIALGVIAATYRSRMAARRTLASVDEIVRQLRGVEADRLSQRLKIDAGIPELERLVTTINELLHRIETTLRVTRRFAADASHELQTPLAAMRAAVERSTMTECDPGEVHEMAAELLAEIDSLSALIRDLRLIALADAGQLVATPERVDLCAITADCCDIARVIAEDKGIRIEVDVRDALVVLGSPQHLRRAILNLAINAIGYSPASSQVSVAMRSVDGHAIVTVQDHGCGIAPDDIPHIFEPFYRAGPDGARHPGGVGLGLAIADEIVRAHAGRIVVTSAPRLGSTFSIVLPLAQPARRSQAN
jgi:signal transduction histidine kinase